MSLMEIIIFISQSVLLIQSRLIRILISLLASQAIQVAMFLIDHLERRNISYKKMDILFYEGIKSAKSSYNRKIGCHTFKLILLIAFMIVDIAVLKTQQWKLLVLMRLGIAVSVINIIINLIIKTVGYRNTSGNNTFYLYLSQQMSHITNEPLNSQQDVSDLQNCVSSTVFNALSQTQNNDPALTPDLRKKYISIYKNLVQGEVLQKNKCLPCIDLLGRMLCLAAVIYGIYALITSHSSLPEIIVLTIYLIIESYNIWAVILVLLLLVFSPLICCIGCIYMVCNGGGFIDADSLDVPTPITANTKVIQKTDGSCTICLQNLNVNEKLIVLNCSDKHAFHEKCIKSWLRVSDTCPICRKSVPRVI